MKIIRVACKDGKDLPWEEYKKLHNTFEKIFGRNSKYSTSYASWIDEFGYSLDEADDAVIWLNNDGTMELEGPDGTHKKFAKGNFSAFQKFVDNYIKEYE